MKPKHNFNISAICFALFAIALLSACSDDPDHQYKYKGKVDSNILSSLAEGKTSIIYGLDRIVILQKNKMPKPANMEIGRQTRIAL